MSLTHYRIRPADPVRDRDTVLALWGQGFALPELHPVKYDWCYGHTAQGEGRLYLLEYGDQGQIIGVQGIVPRRWWHRGEQIENGICADLVVDQQHRSIGPALTLVSRVIELEQQRDTCCLLYAFPNQKTEALYRRKGYRRVTELTRYSKPLRLHVWLERKGLAKSLAWVLGKMFDLASQTRLMMGNWRRAQHGKLVTVSAFDGRFDRLWSRISKTAGSMAVRDSASLQWRFTNAFVGAARIMVLQTGEGEIDGYIVYTIDHDDLVIVLDFLAGNTTTALTALFGQFAREMYRQGHNGIMLEFSGSPEIEHGLRALGFFARETHPVYVVRMQAHEPPPDGNTLYLTGSDRDQ